MTALHLISYALATSGGTIEGQTMRWAPMLEIACDWLTQTGVLVDENPRRTLVNMSAGGAFATKVTMYMDICMSVTLQQPPRLLALYRRLLGGGTSYWPGSGSHRGGVGSSAGVVDDLRLSEVTGCTDPVLLAFADISALAHWKARELANGTLSLRDLIARGTAIERALRERGEMITAEASRLLEYGRPAEDHSRRMIAAIFLESAVVYLNTVLSGCNPGTLRFVPGEECRRQSATGVPEIIRSVNTIVQMLQYMPAGNHDRALLLPLCLTGSLVDSAQHRELIRSRLFRISSGNATVKQIIVVLNEIWQRRDVQGGIYDWRDVMREQGWTPLLV
ncbi:hypothetical protein DENSPDRAFT_832876 [Dentipellis sp. KUC8613]|nr:hypothetical protein DENSPDRAFT_832876 [Dentipellis sp. KUC8613]